MTSLVRHMWELVSRITGFSTPLFGVSWNNREMTTTKSNALGDSPVFTPGECAQVLHVDEQAVIDLLESGRLRGLSVAGEWRVTSGQVTEFLHEQSRAKELEGFARRISDPKVWATKLQGMPEMMKEIQTGEYAEGSIGKFLQDSLETVEEDGDNTSEV